MALWTAILSVVAVVGFIAPTDAWYLPGTAPTEYNNGDSIQVLVNAYTPEPSYATDKLESLISYDYYEPRFHNCQPASGPQPQSESLGSILLGDRIFSSPYKIEMLESKTCQRLCSVTISPEDAKFVNQRIRESMSVNWLIDGLPAAQLKKTVETKQDFYSVGFDLGDMRNGPILNNHMNIIIQYHQIKGKYRVVGVLVEPESHASSGPIGGPDCSSAQPLRLREDLDNSYDSTYSVKFVESEVRWATRWDNYLKGFNSRIHYFGIINSIVIVGFLVSLISYILMRTLRRDIARYKAYELSVDQVTEEAGWKLLHGEVFRPPRYPILLATLVGSGSHLIAMTGTTLIFAVLGILSPANRGSLATTMLVFYLFFSCIAGYVSTRLYSTFRGQGWKRNVFATAFALPGTVFSVVLLLNFWLISARASGAVPFGTLLVLVVLWFVIAVPLVFAGSYLALKQGAFSLPVKTNQIPRQIPPQPTLFRPVQMTMIGGLLPFSASFIELFMILTSLWYNRLYYLFGFLFIAWCVTMVTTSLVTVLTTYLHLSTEEYRWHWRAFLTGGIGLGLYTFLYSVFTMITRTSLNTFTAKVLYLGYSLLASAALGTMFGSVSFISAGIFLHLIYSRVRVD